MSVSTSHTAAKNVAAITSAQRELIQDLIGAPLAPEQRVFIMAYSPNVEPTHEQKTEGANRALELLDQACTNIRASGISDGEITVALGDAKAASKK
jgi:hypothetical protein